MKKDWETKTLGDFFDITSSKRVFKSDWTSDGVPFYRAREIVSLSKNKPLKDPIFISAKMYEEYAYKYGKPEEGDILVTGVGTLGICYVVKKNDKFYFKDGNIIWLKNTSNVNTKFIEYFFKSKELIDQINSAPVGATVGTFTIIRAKNTVISIPSESEQKRIVKILDEKFETIEKLKSVAKHQLTSAQELFNSKLNEVFLEIYTRSTLSTMSEVYDIRDGTHASPIYQDKGYPLVTSKNLKNGELSLDKINYISERDYLDICKRSAVSKGDVLFAMIGTIGNPVVINIVPDFAIKNVALFKVPKNQNSNFLRYFLMTKFVIDKMKKEAKGTTQQFVGLGYLRSFPIPIVSLAEQVGIVQELDMLSEKTKELEVIFRGKILELEELKKSYLHEAFSGNL